MLRKAEQDLRRYTEELKTLVEERTAALKEVNRQLQAELEERRQAEEALHEMNVALAHAMPGISRLDPDGRYIHVNEPYARMIGYEPDEMIGMDWKPTVHPDDHQHAIAAYKRMVSEDKAEFEARAVRKDGSVFHKYVLMVKCTDKEGHFIGHHCFMRDITERKQAEATHQALYRASLQIQEPLRLEDRLARLLHTAKEVLQLDRLNILLADSEGQWLQAVASLGTEQPLETIRVPIGPEGGGIAQAYLTKVAIFWDGQAPVPEELRLKPPYNRIEAFRSRCFAILPMVIQGRAIGVLGADRKRSGRPMDETALPLLQLFASQAAIAIEHARLYQEIQQHAATLEGRVQERTRELQEAMRLAEEASRHKSEFLANMSHELRTPLNAVIGFSELLEDQKFGPLNEKQHRYVHHIWTSGRHLLALINDILDLSKVEVGRIELKPEPFHLPEALQAALHTVRPQAEAKAIQLALNVEACPPTLVADPTRFTQILYNLLSNAVKFTPDGGSVTLAARVQRPTSEVQSPGGTDVGPWTSDAATLVEISVQDTGIGIKAEDLSRLFQPFTQLDASLAKRYQGTGLGLALTKRLVELHGGTIRAESAGEGKGSTFTVTLPLRPPERARPRLLLVDDDVGLGQALATPLEEAGYKVEMITDGQEALTRLEQRLPDLLLLDLGLPGCDGWEILATLRAQEATRHLPIIIFTGMQGVSEAEIKRLGASEFLTKPFSITVLLQVIGRLLDRGHNALPSGTPASA